LEGGYHGVTPSGTFETDKYKDNYSLKPVSFESTLDEKEKGRCKK
jgi:hypothetical protein